eukprot:NODE_129_length_3566_cov_5.542890.p1 GENE.NODE_129_length_3566_cov_5.542890~~NODE_129_length_3566_cov_5.542890.p1  ORF type:complete len:585 (-),score=145.68 NODE_129_length_3566_cov_5.542890:1811-3421(-)
MDDVWGAKDTTSTHAGRSEVLRMPVDLITKQLRRDSSSSSEVPAEDTEPVVMQTWDFVGQANYYAMAHIFLTSFGIYVLVLDLSQWQCRDDSFEGLSAELDDSVGFWLAAISFHAPGARVVIVGSHNDRLQDDRRKTVHADVNTHLVSHLRKVPTVGERLVANQDQQLHFFPVDNSHSTVNDGVASLRAALDKVALEVADSLDRIPMRWAHFLPVLRIADEKCLSLEECQRRAHDFGFKNDEVDRFLAHFHSLGQLLHFPGASDVVLDPQWLLDAMANIVGCPQILRQASHLSPTLLDNGELADELLHELWAESRFRDQERVLISFLEHFDLIVPITLAGNNRKWLVPSHLPAATRPPRTATVAVLLDFKGALRHLLPTLLARIICYVRREADAMIIRSARDAVLLTFGRRPKIHLSLEALPGGAPEVLRLGVASAGVFTPVSDNLERALKLVSDAVSAWNSNINFSVWIPCPLCVAAGLCAGDDDGGSSCGCPYRSGMHLLGLHDVLSLEEENMLICSELQRIVSEDQLPHFIRE